MLICFDCHNLCHALKHKTKGLSFRGSNTGIIYGFIRQILSLQEHLQGDSWLFAWDSSRKNSVRRKAYSKYKADREGKLTKEEERLNRIALPQFYLLRDTILPALGFRNVLKFEGFEADDILAYAALREEFRPCVIVSRDQDLYQTLRPDVHIYKTVESRFYTLQDFYEEWGLEPEDWAAIKAIAGCKSDNIQGVESVAEITATKYWLNKLPKNSKLKQKITKHKDRIVRNLSLTCLPHADFKGFPIYDGCVNVGVPAFASLMEKYGMNSLLSAASIERWRKAFWKE